MFTELLEHRRFLSAGEASPILPPQVRDVWVSSSEWTLEFRQQLAIDYGGADSRYGWPLSEGFTWVNVDRVTVRFTRAVEAAPDDVLLHGVNTPLTTPVSVEHEYDKQFGFGVATWTLPRPIGADKFILEVDGGPGGVRSSEPDHFALDGDNDYEPGGDFLRRFSVLPANTSGMPYVGVDDLSWVRQALNTSIARRGVGNGSYTILRDLNGDGRINSVDLAEVRRRYLSRLPFGEPTVSAAGATTSAGRLRPLTRSLFSSEPILA